MDKRYLGDLGENTLRNWASQVGITAIKADPDRAGWDYILEFPLNQDSVEGITLPLDKISRPIQAFIQVKATDNQKAKRSVKLSNWLRLVKSPLPAFFLILEFDSMPSCQRAYLVHIDKVYICKVLQRLRNFDLNTRHKLHKKYLQLNWGEENQLSELNGECLANSICSCIENFEMYVENKLDNIRRVGYEDGKWQLDISVPLPGDHINAQEILVDFSLGLIPHLDVMQGKIWESRFGIRASEPTETFENGLIELVNKSVLGSAAIILTAPDEISELKIITELYTPQGIAFPIYEKYIKHRFAAPYLDFLFWPHQRNKAEFRFTLPKTSEIIRLKELQPVAKYVLFLHNAADKNGKLKFKVVYENKAVYTGFIGMQDKISKEVVDYAAVLMDAWKVVKYFDIQDTVDVEPRELINQARSLSFMASVLTPPYPSVRILNWFSESRISSGKSICLPYGIFSVIGQYIISIALAVICRPEDLVEIKHSESRWEYKFETFDLRIFHKYVSNRDETPKYTHKDLAQRIVDENEEIFDILVVSGINDYLVLTQ